MAQSYADVLQELYRTFTTAEVLNVFKAFELIHSIQNVQLKRAVKSLVASDQLVLDPDKEKNESMRKKILKGIPTDSKAQGNNLQQAKKAPEEQKASDVAKMNEAAAQELLTRGKIMEKDERDDSTQKGKMIAGCGLSYVSHNPDKLTCSRGGTQNNVTEKYCRQPASEGGKCQSAKDKDHQVGLKQINDYYNQRYKNL